MRRTVGSLSSSLYLVDLLLTLASLAAAEQIRRWLDVGAEIAPEMSLLHPILFLMVGFIWTAIFFAFPIYGRRQLTRFRYEIRTLLAATGTATLVFAGALYLSFRDLPRLLFIYFFIVDASALVLARVVRRDLIPWLFHRPVQVRRVLIVGAGKVGTDLAERIDGHRWSGLELVGFLDDDPAKRGQEIAGHPVFASLPDAVWVVPKFRIDEVIIALPLRAHQRMVDLAVELQRLPVQVWIVPDLFDLAFPRTSIQDFGGIPLVGLREPPIDGAARAVKRAFDLVIAGALLVLLVPAILAIALAIRLDSRGPILYRQQRVGENARLFRMLKFRSMVDGADQELGAVLKTTNDGKLLHKTPDDHRVTRVGRFLRRTSLDELPQLWNVLVGDMTLVGPRPEMPFLVERYDPWQWKRFCVPQGITGWWQINGRSDKPMHLNTEYDLYYIQNYSLLLDLRILAKTVVVVLKGNGAY
ncbi:MAG: sugar transferase [Chloroflexi bacterium]|nr:sugar transferase [Chloroflexota bacterium]